MNLIVCLLELIQLKKMLISYVEIGEIQNCITKSTKKLTEESTRKSLIDKLSNKLLRLEFKSNNAIKTKCLKYVVKIILPNL